MATANADALRTEAYMTEGHFKNGMSILLGGLFFCHLGCAGKTETALRFEMERLLVQADRLQDQSKLKSTPLSEKELSKLIESYQKIADKVTAVADLNDIEKASDDKKQTWAIGSLALTRIGNLYLNSGIYDKAYASFQAVARNPTITAVQKNAVLSYMALALQKLDQFQEAAAVYDSLALGYLAILAPQNPNIDALDAPLKSADMWMRAGERKRYLEKMDQAETYYRTLINTHKGTLLEAAAIGKLSGAYLQQSRFADAIEILKTVRDDSTGNISPTIMLTIADIYMNRLHDCRNAEQTYRDFIKFYPKHESKPTAQLGLGLSLYEQTRYTDARKAVQGIEKSARVRHNIVAQAFFLVALCYEREDKWELAKGQFDIVQSSFIGTEHAFEATLHVAAYYRNHGMTALAEKSFESSLRYIEKYIAENSANPLLEAKARGHLVRAYTENGDFLKAAEQLAGLHERFPQFPEGKMAPLRLGELYETVIGDTAKALDWLRIFAQENSDADSIGDIKNHIRDLEIRTGKTVSGS